jgi:carbonic anhydrase/acetyltransferase-like protein (isoleucine patch superfamily)
MAIYSFEGIAPQIHPDAWVADEAQVVGKVALGEGSSVWYGAVIRADNDRITIGARTSIQDGCVLHTDAGFHLQVGNDCVIGHQAMLHGCQIGDCTLIGIQAVILNKARIGRHCIVGAGAFVPEGKEFPDGVLILGAPAKVARELTPEQIAGLQRIAPHYVAQAQRHRTAAKRIA